MKKKNNREKKTLLNHSRNTPGSEITTTKITIEKIPQLF